MIVYHAGVPDVSRIFQIAADMAVLLFAVSLHESAHGAVASKLGDPTAERLGRITLNPLRHIDPIGSIIFPLVLAISGAPVFGWAKPVPVNVALLRNPRRDSALVSFAGPASNLLVALLSVVVLFGMKLANPRFPELVLQVLGHEGVQGAGLIVPVVYLLVSLLVVNLVLALFNLLPVPPLDGSAVLAAVLPPPAAATFNRLGRYGMLIVFALLWLGAFDLVIRPVIVFVLGLLIW